MAPTWPSLTALGCLLAAVQPQVRVVEESDAGDTTTLSDRQAIPRTERQGRPPASPHPRLLSGGSCAVATHAPNPSWAAEARERWGRTPQWIQYAEHAAVRSAEDWQHITQATSVLHEDLAAAMRAGVGPGSDTANALAANALAERHRASIAAYFDCTHSMHVCLGRTCVDEPGFTAYCDAIEPGSARWLSEIVDANARCHGVDPHTASWTRHPRTEGHVGAGRHRLRR